MSIAIIEPTLTPPDDMLYERVGGRFVEKRVSTLAALLANDLSEEINRFAKPKKFGRAMVEVVFVLDPEQDLRRRPDVAFVSEARWPHARLTPLVGDWAIAPELAVEVISPSNSMPEMMRKIREYFRHGVSEVWLALPEERSVHCYSGPKSVRILDAADTLSTPLLSGWSLTVGDWLPVLSESDASSSTVGPA